MSREEYNEVHLRRNFESLKEMWRGSTDRNFALCSKYSHKIISHFLRGILNTEHLQNKYFWEELIALFPFIDTNRVENEKIRKGHIDTQTACCPATIVGHTDTHTARWFHKPHNPKQWGGVTQTQTDSKRFHNTYTQEFLWYVTDLTETKKNCWGTRTCR
jgi:hypothetical protein